nr:hydrogenase expression/formation C-terminal domain-containing protein [Gammaproteobacteria bacterium]
NAKVPAYMPGAPPHVMNLPLLLHTKDDIGFLTAMLGSGPVVILSRGYGHCRNTSTATRSVWWV